MAFALNLSPTTEASILGKVSGEFRTSRVQAQEGPRKGSACWKGGIGNLPGDYFQAEEGTVAGRDLGAGEFGVMEADCGPQQPSESSPPGREGGRSLTGASLSALCVGQVIRTQEGESLLPTLCTPEAAPHRSGANPGGWGRP